MVAGIRHLLHVKHAQQIEQYNELNHLFLLLISYYGIACFALNCNGYLNIFITVGNAVEWQLKC